MDKLSARPNRVSYIKHRQDVNRQIILPIVFVGVMIAIFAALICFAGFWGGGDVSKWAAAAIIWMVIPMTFFLLLILAAAGGAAYLLTRLRQVSPRYTGIAQAYVLWFNAQVVSWTNRLILPLIRLQAWLDLFSGEAKKAEETSHVREK